MDLMICNHRKESDIIHDAEWSHHLTQLGFKLTVTKGYLRTVHGQDTSIKYLVHAVLHGYVGLCSLFDNYRVGMVLHCAPNSVI